MLIMMWFPRFWFCDLFYAPSLPAAGRRNAEPPFLEWLQASTHRIDGLAGAGLHQPDRFTASRVHPEGQ
jgi:hypothetical protein